MAKILLVEDNEMNRDMLSRRLTKRGYDVAIAVDGQEGVDAATAQQPDLILLDMSLPVLDGWTAARMLKADPATAAIPIIALTANVMAESEAAARAIELDGFLPKPLVKSDLLETVHRWTSVHRRGSRGA